MSALLLALTAQFGAVEHDLHAFIAADVWPTPKLGLHGVAFLGWRMRFEQGVKLEVVFNTDTLSLTARDLCFGDLCISAQLKGEYAIAGLLGDYYQGGQLIKELGFSASYLEGELALKWSPQGQHFFDYAFTPRRWFFSATGSTRDDLVLPPDTWVLQQYAGYTYWSLQDDGEWHRPSPRFSGFGFGLRAGLGYRLDRVPWGAPEDPRNAPAQVVLTIRQWARFGLKAGRARLQLSQWSGFGLGEDDLSRSRLGGLNPYVVPLAGAPWAAFLASRFIAGQLAVPVRLFGEVELSPLIDLIYLQDVARAGDDALDAVVGLGFYLDVRFGSWQLDLKGGWAPPLAWQRDHPHLSVYLLLGRQIL